MPVLTARCTTPTTLWLTSTTCCHWAPCLDLRGLVLLVPQDVRPNVQRVSGSAALLGHVRWREPDLLPAALPRPRRMPRRYIDYRTPSVSLTVSLVRLLRDLRRHADLLLRRDPGKLPGRSVRLATIRGALVQPRWNDSEQPPPFHQFTTLPQDRLDQRTLRPDGPRSRGPHSTNKG